MFQILWAAVSTGGAANSFQPIVNIVNTQKAEEKKNTKEKKEGRQEQERYNPIQHSNPPPRITENSASQEMWKGLSSVNPLFSCIFPFSFPPLFFLLCRGVWAISPVVAFSSLTLDVVFFFLAHTPFRLRPSPFARFSPDNREMASSSWRKKSKSSSSSSSSSRGTANKRILPSRIGSAARWEAPPSCRACCWERSWANAVISIYTNTHTHTGWLAGWLAMMIIIARKKEEEKGGEFSSSFFSFFKWVIYLLLLW